MPAPLTAGACGQMVGDAAGEVALGNGAVILARTKGGVQRWFELAAPTPIPPHYDSEPHVRLTSRGDSATARPGARAMGSTDGLQQPT